MNIMTQNRAFAVCVNNTGYEASLEQRKIYQVLSDDAGRDSKLLRVIDESGEDYLYPERMFVHLELPPEAQEAFAPVA